MTDIYNITLKENFGHDELKPLQHDLIKSIMNKKDVIGILATGYGKSICYQLPFFLLNKTIIIICPLIALMEDQKKKLENKDIPVICFNSNLSSSIKEYEKTELLSGNHKIVYMTPEYLNACQDFILELWDKDFLGFIAIDEAHCLSSWGNDFRPEYKQLSCLKEWIPELNIMALTATATNIIKKDIIDTLKLNNYKEFISSFDRPNLYIELNLKSSDIKFDLEPYIKENGNEKCIIYVRTRDMTDKITKILKSCKLKAESYHAGLEIKERNKIQEDFLCSKFNWIVATIAFGMGIDADINLVIHYGSPGDIESYYQEIGRAGRDGTASRCIMFYEKDDMRINRLLLKDIKDENHKKNREKQIKSMQAYLRTEKCRKIVILEYFGEKIGACMNCDNCLRKKESINHIQTHIQYPIYLLLKFMVESKICGGITKILNVLIGKKDSKIKDYYKSKFYGLGKNYELNYWKHIASICIHNNLISEETIKSGYGTILKITSETVKWHTNVKEILKNNNIKSDDYENIMFIKNDICREYNIPRDCKNIDTYIKIQHISGIEEILDNI